MFETKDKKKKFGSGFAAKKYDSFHPSEDKSMPMGESKAEPRTNAMGEAKTSSAEASAPDNDVKDNPENVDPAAVRAEHGPAEEVTVHHSHDDNKHHVVSRHPKTGHVHHSVHRSAQEAHDAASELAGAGEQSTESMPGESSPEPDGFSMPRLA